MADTSGNGKLGWNYRTIVLIAVVSMWVICVVADVVLEPYEVPAQVHMALLGLIGYLFKDVLPSRKGDGN